MGALEDLIGQSPGIAAVRERVGRLLSRPSDSRRLPPVLIQGETGTGKGLMAQAIHRAGPRAAGPFVDVNCAAIPETLLEAEMFGFERGAFTDARQAKRGLFQAAHHGTLFLDEVGLLAEGLQAKLLKVIEERVVRRLGSTQSESVDVWIITATSLDLQAATRERRFREDLYHRLAVLTLWLPPLRERGQDVLLLAEHFLARACADYELAPRSLAPEARAALLAYRWPGNIRELSNVMERVALLAETLVVTTAALGLPDPPPTSAAVATRSDEGVALVEAVEGVERAHLLEALRETEWNVTRAAARLGISRNTLRYRIEKYGLRPGVAPPAVPRRTTVQAAPAPVETASVLVEAPAPSAVRWERRRLTVMRAALTVPPGEEVSLDSNRVLEIFVDKARTFGGRVEDLSPTAVVAVFGLEPIEDAPRRAANAAMAIHRAAERAGGGDGGRCAARVGIHVSQFMVGRVGGVAELDQDAKREAWRVVEELIADSEPGTTFVSAAAAPFLVRRFDLVAVGPPEGRTGQAYCLAKHERGEFEPGQRMARFVGRHRELELLRSFLTSAMAGHGQVVGIAGEAGIGKSRLLFEFRQGLIGQSVQSLEGRCLSSGSALPYLPVLDLLKAACGITEADGREAVMTKVAAALEEVGMSPLEGCAYLLHLLGIDEGGDRLAVLGPEAIRARTFDLLRQMSVKRSRRHPLVLVVEDLHWVDKTSEEYLASLVESLAGARILLVATHRFGYRPPWLEKSYATQVALQPLAAEDSLSVVRSVLGTDVVAESLVQRILDKAEGNPFFLEELARAVREQGGVSATLSVPGTVQEVLLARIDRLPPQEKRLLQSAAVIGKDVPLSLLEALADLSPDVLRRCLVHLQVAEFLYETSFVPEPEYTFKHALTHEVAYGSLLEEQRRVLHARIVEAIEQRAPDGPSPQIERLAHHAFLAETWEKALSYLRQAGAKAFARASHREAVAYFEQALAALGHLSESRDRIEQGIDIRFDLRTSLLPLGELRRGLDYLHEAERLATALNDRHRVGWLSVYMMGQFYLMGDQDRAFEIGQRALAIAQELQDFSLNISTNAYVGQVYHVRGDYRRAAAFFRKNVEALVDAHVHERFGLPQLPSVHSRTCLVWCLAELGEFGEGIVHGEEGIRIAESVDQPLSLTVAYSGLGSLYLRQGDIQRAISILERGLELSRAWSIPLWFPRVASALGSAYAIAGRVREALPLLERAVEQAASMNLMSGHSLLVSSLGEAQLWAGRLDVAQDLARRALDLSKQHTERGYEAWTLRLLGEIALRQSPPEADRAREYCRQALELAHELGMRPLIAHCHLGLGQAHRRQGQRPDAEEHLTKAAALLREMNMQRGLAQAEAELQEVR